MIPQILIIFWLSIRVGAALQRLFEKKDRIGFVAELLFAGIIASVLWWGGFWEAFSR